MSLYRGVNLGLFSWWKIIDWECLEIICRGMTRMYLEGRVTGRRRVLHMKHAIRLTLYEILGLDLPSPQGAIAPRRPVNPQYRGFTITTRHSTLGRTNLDEWSARCRDFFPTAQHSQQTNIHVSARVEPTVSSNERPQSHALHPAATGIGLVLIRELNVTGCCGQSINKHGKG
jgi:hypothetical protein